MSPARPRSGHPARVVGAVAATILTGILAIQYVLAVKPAVEREQSAALAQTCLGLEPTANAALGSLPKPAPEIVAVDVKGERQSLPSLFRGRVVLLNFWASWCPPCLEEIPSMEQLQARFSPDDLVIAGVSSDESWEVIREQFGAGPSFWVFLDPSAKGSDSNLGALASLYGTEKLPDTYVIDRQGNVRFYVMNRRDWNDPKIIRCLQAVIAE